MNPEASRLPLLTTRPVGRADVMRRLRTRELPARLAILSFLWAMLLGPALHLVNHRDDHRHGAAAAATHDHGAGGAAHRHAPAPRAGNGRSNATTTAAFAGDDANQPDRRSPPLGPHGGGEALHFGLALLDSATPPPALVPDPTPETATPLFSGMGPARRELGGLSARGPPPATWLAITSPGRD
jgi:hypothetical protein